MRDNEKYLSAMPTSTFILQKNGFEASNSTRMVQWDTDLYINNLIYQNYKIKFIGTVPKLIN